MKARVTVITLGVDDLDRALSFYRDGLGFDTDGIIGQEFEHGAVVFFELQPGVVMRGISRILISIYGRWYGILRYCSTATDKLSRVEARS